ncbi:MAG: hypothetical protein SVM79_02705 [Chloroflexota bacterium]|nr:hypothetical protein [Chloroflexota bacterium]
MIRHRVIDEFVTAPQGFFTDERLFDYLREMYAKQEIVQKRQDELSQEWFWQK